MGRQRPQQHPWSGYVRRCVTRKKLTVRQMPNPSTSSSCPSLRLTPTRPGCGDIFKSVKNCNMLLIDADLLVGFPGLLGCRQSLHRPLCRAAIPHRDGLRCVDATTCYARRTDQVEGVCIRTRDASGCGVHDGRTCRGFRARRESVSEEPGRRRDRRGGQRDGID